MSDQASRGLRRLHTLHRELHEVQDELRRGPRQIEARRKRVEARREEFQTRKDQLKQLKMAADHKSLQLKTSEAKLADLRTKLNLATSNREYDIIRGQIDADTVATSVLEDEILEQLEKVDQVQSLIVRTEKEVREAEQQVDALQQSVSQSEPVLTRKAAELEAAIRDAESSLPATVMESYRRLVGAHGAEALASVESRACTACNAILSPQEIVNLNTGKLIFCRSCGRLLYAAEGGAA